MFALRVTIRILNHTPAFVLEARAPVPTRVRPQHLDLKGPLVPLLPDSLPLQV